MTSNALTTLMKKLFLLIAVALLLGMPLAFFGQDNLSQIETPSLATLDAAGLGFFAGIMIFTLVVVWIIFLHVIPAIIEVVQAAWNAYRNREQEPEIFP